MRRLGLIRNSWRVEIWKLVGLGIKLTLILVWPQPAITKNCVKQIRISKEKVLNCSKQSEVSNKNY